MTEKKPHVKLTNSIIETTNFAYKPRFVPNDKTEPTEVELKDFTIMASRFESSYNTYLLQRNLRITNRTIDLLYHIEYIEILFFSQFDLRKFRNSYNTQFGLEAIKLTEFNHKVLFAVIDDGKFNHFFAEIEKFIESKLTNPDIKFDNKIVFINDFTIHNSQSIKQYSEAKPIFRFSLLDGLDIFTKANSIENSLDEYLKQKKVEYYFDRPNNSIEILNIDENQVNEIIDNFDIVFSVTSSLSTVIGPSLVKIPERSYGFEISNFDKELPIIGVIDTGIDDRTPLAAIIIGGIDKTGTNATEDIVDHGTAVAALCSLGKEPYLTNFRGELKADAKLLSLKVLNHTRGALSDFTVISIIKEAKFQYPEMKLFVLTINYEDSKKINEVSSDYAFQLDKLAYELDVLIFISTSNNNKAADDLNAYDSLYFNNEKTNLNSPAESLNNITIGASADNLDYSKFVGVSPLRDFPSLYSRTGHIEQNAIRPKFKINKHLKKPDFLQPGGDYEYYLGFIGAHINASLILLSSDPTQSFYEHIGTSFSAPLAANLGAKILKNYPDLNVQSIKALLINSCASDTIKEIDENKDIALKKAIGYGYPSDVKAVFSDSNRVTFILEREIKHKELIAIPIKLPDYLRALKKDKGILKFTATLCFSFLPNKDNQLTYCPLFMAFSIFKNKTTVEINSDLKNSKLRNSWSQDGYSQLNAIINSNVQKMEFTVSKNNIIEEDGTFMLAIHCFISPHILASIGEIKRRKTNSNKFSIVLTVEEIQPKAKLTGNLYNEMIAINSIEAIDTLDTTLEAEL